MVCEFRADLGTVLAVFFALVLFGVAYNALVSWMMRYGYTEGYMSLVVALGVFATLCAAAILSIQAALLALGAFVASGTPMVIGSIIRYLKARDAAKRAILHEVKR